LFFTHIFTGNFKELTARRFYKLFGVKGFRASESTVRTTIAEFQHKNISTAAHSDDEQKSALNM
jgi:hypothetical protein